MEKLLELDFSVRAFKPYPVQFSVESVGGLIEEEKIVLEEEESVPPRSVNMSTGLPQLVLTLKISC